MKYNYSIFIFHVRKVGRYFQNFMFIFRPQMVGLTPAIVLGKGISVTSIFLQVLLVNVQLPIRAKIGTIVLYNLFQYC
jgi:hypothetical protein